MKFPDPLACDEPLLETCKDVTDDRPLVAFLYHLLRDHVVMGAVEKIMGAIEYDPPANTWLFSNRSLATYCKELADRIEHDSSDCHTSSP